MIAEAARVDSAVSEESQSRRNEPDPQAGLPPAPGEVPLPEDKKPRRRRVPSSRNREIYRQVKIFGRSERNVARVFELTQPRVFAICKQVRLWNEENGGNRPDQTPQASHNLALANARLRLSYTYSQAVKWLEVSGMPTQTERIKAGEETGDVVKKCPRPNPAFLGHMLRSAIELAKLEGAYDASPALAASIRQSADCSVQEAECRVVTRQEPRPRSIAEFTRAMEDARKYTPSEELLSARGGALAFAHVPEFRDENANELRAAGCSELAVLDAAAHRHLQAKNNYYRAVAEAHAPPGDKEAADLIGDALVDLDADAAKADALAWNEVLGSPQQKDQAQAAPQIEEQVISKRQSFLETILLWDSNLDLTDESYAAVMNRYRPETGRFDWLLDLGERDLAPLAVQQWELQEEEEEEDLEEEQEEDEDDEQEEEELEEEDDAEPGEG